MKKHFTLLGSVLLTQLVLGALYSIFFLVLYGIIQPTFPEIENFSSWCAGHTLNIELYNIIFLIYTIYIFFALLFVFGIIISKEIANMNMSFKTYCAECIILFGMLSLFNIFLLKAINVFTIDDLRIRGIFAFSQQIGFAVKMLTYDFISEKENMTTTIIAVFVENLLKAAALIIGYYKTLQKRALLIYSTTN